MDEIFLKNPQLIPWIKHSEESIFLNQDDLEFIKELLLPIEDEFEKDQCEGRSKSLNLNEQKIRYFSCNASN